MNELNLLVENYFTDSFEASDLFRLVEQVMDNNTPTKKILNEKINQGDVIEGIFAIAVALNLAFDQVDSALVEGWRKKIEPALHKKGVQTFQVVDSSDITSPEKDRIIVNLHVRLKSEKTTGGLFGVNYIEDIPQIAKKQEALIAHIGDSAAMKKIREFKKELFTNGRRDTIIFTVIADGLGGEQAEGNIKGDVIVTVEAYESETGEIIRDPIVDQNHAVPFSIKSESTTVANLSPFVGMIQVANWFGLGDVFGCVMDAPITADTIPMNCATDYLAIRRHTKANPNLANRNATKAEKKNATLKMWATLRDRLLANQSAPDFKEKVFSFLEYSAFGDDLADVVDITETTIKEIRAVDIAALKNDPNLIIAPKVEGSDENQTLKFYRIPIDPHTGERTAITAEDLLYQLRVKISWRKKAKHREGGVEYDPRSVEDIEPGKTTLELKFYPEVGNLAYMKK